MFIHIGDYGSGGSSNGSSNGSIPTSIPPGVHTILANCAATTHYIGGAGGGARTLLNLKILHRNSIFATKEN